MNFFNIDMHISVVNDLKWIFKRLGHTIDDVCISGHAFVLNRKQAVVDYLMPDSINTMIEAGNYDRFWNENKDELDKYDGYICCYPPMFAMLYQTSKPIIVQIPIRFDHMMYHSPKLINELIESLKRPNVILIANNKFDKYYAELFIGKEVTHIPSLCEYSKERYNPINKTSLYFSSNPVSELSNTAIKKEVALQAGYTWKHRAEFLSAIHLPYQISTMSIFELYSECVPMFFPSIELMWILNRVYVST